jgi:hypothetical protein
MGVPSLTTVWVPLQGVVHTLDGGPVSLFCKSGSPYAYVHSASLIAVQVNAATGDVTPF